MRVGTIKSCIEAAKFWHIEDKIRGYAFQNDMTVDKIFTEKGIFFETVHFILSGDEYQINAFTHWLEELTKD